jgi:NAD(P)-dependent dehydrogenase (short-subunit alcohol dehydrogenase family)
MKEKRTILVTGAANGIGLAITEFLAKNGYTVLATDFNETDLQKLSSRENIHTIFLDVTNKESIQKAVEQSLEITDCLDGLVNNAGVFNGGPLLEIPVEELHEIININVLGMIRVTQAFFFMLEKKKGKIINLSSEVGRFAFPFNGPYSISKYAIEAFSDSLRRELMFIGMKVVIIQPGAIATSLPQKTLDVYGKYVENSIFKKQLTRVWSILGKEKYGDPVEVAKTVHNALKRKNPKSRYRVSNNKQRRILEYLPTSFADFMIKHFVK